MKKCAHCGEEKDISSFGSNKRMKDGLHYYCNECRRNKTANRKKDIGAYNKKYYRENIEREKERHIKYREENQEMVNARARKYYADNQDKCRDKATNYREENREIALERTRKWRRKNKRHRLEYGRKYREANKEKVNSHFREYIKTRQEGDSEFMIRLKIRSRFKAAIKNGWRTRFEETGHRYSDYVDHFERLQPGMISKYLKGGGYHIDHIIPVSAYDMNNPEDIRKCWNPSNMRIINKYQNMSKGNAIDLSLVKDHEIEHLMPGYGCA